MFQNFDHKLADDLNFLAKFYVCFSLVIFFKNSLKTFDEYVALAMAFLVKSF